MVIGFHSLMPECIELSYRYPDSFSKLMPDICRHGFACIALYFSQQKQIVISINEWSGKQLFRKQYAYEFLWIALWFVWDLKEAETAVKPVGERERDKSHCRLRRSVFGSCSAHTCLLEMPNESNMIISQPGCNKLEWNVHPAPLMICWSLHEMA